MIGKTFDTKSKNIDNLVDMMVSVQRENGIEPTMKEALFDPITKERINVFKRKKLEEKGVDLSEYGESVTNNTKCDKCKSKDKHVSNIERGVFVYSEDDLVDEEDGIYVCEFCSKIGYQGNYKPDICDTCDDCIGCSDYMNGSCDGCEYSVTYNNGNAYGQGGTGTEVDAGDSITFDEINNDPNYEVEKPTRKFTIMDY